jgi:hypothetical protein
MGALYLEVAWLVPEAERYGTVVGTNGAIRPSGRLVTGLKGMSCSNAIRRRRAG